MQKLSLKFGAKTRTLKLPIDWPENIFVEAANGEGVRAQKIYHVGGRAGCFKILITDFEGENLRRQLEDLKHDYSVSESENKILTKDLENWQEIAPTPSEIKEKLENLESECNSVQTAIENFEYKLGLQTKCRQTFDRIDALAEILEEKIRKLENEKDFLEDEISGLKIDNRALAWQIEELEKWKENTLKNEETTLFN